MACTNWILDCYNPDGWCVVFMLLWFVAVFSYYTMGVKEQPSATVLNFYIVFVTTYVTTQHKKIEAN